MEVPVGVNGELLTSMQYIRYLVSEAANKFDENYKRSQRFHQTFRDHFMNKATTAAVRMHELTQVCNESDYVLAHKSNDGASGISNGNTDNRPADGRATKANEEWVLAALKRQAKGIKDALKTLRYLDKSRRSETSMHNSEIIHLPVLASLATTVFNRTSGDDSNLMDFPSELRELLALETREKDCELCLKQITLSKVSWKRIVLQQAYTRTQWQCC